jgi:hypothetical protein
MAKINKDGRTKALKPSYEHVQKSDFVAEIVAERSRKNPRFPVLLDQAIRSRRTS